MSESNLALLQAQARQVELAASAKYANYTLTMVVVGLHIFMALSGLSAFLEMPRSRREGRTVYIALGFLLTIMSTLSASLDMYRMFKCLLEAEGPFGYMETALKYALTWERNLSGVCLLTMVLIGDGLLIYRCFIIWKRNWFAIALPALTYLAYCGMGMAFIIPLFSVTEIKPELAKGIRTREAAWIMLNVVTNVIVTSLIAFKLLSNRRELARIMPNRDLRMYTGVVEMLIESVAPLSVFGIVYAAVGVVAKGEGEVVTNVFSFLYYSLCSLAPHLIIFRVTTNKTWAHTPPCQWSADGAHTTPRQRPATVASIALSSFAPRHLDDSRELESRKVPSGALDYDTTSRSVKCEV